MENTGRHSPRNNDKRVLARRINALKRAEARHLAYIAERTKLIEELRAKLADPSNYEN